MITTVITTKNSEKHLKNCIDSLITQLNKKDEIIIVDNYSNDKTFDIANKYGDKVKFYTKGGERSIQRNFGIKKSKFEKILFLDSDMIISKNLIKKINDKLDEYDAIYIEEMILGENLFNKIRRHERKLYSGTYIDCVRAFKKKIFNKVGGFDESLTGPEDWDFNNKINLKYKTHLLEIKKINFNGKVSENNYIDTFIKNNISINELYSQCIYHNEIDLNLTEYIYKKAYYSESFKIYKDKWMGSKFVKEQLSFRGRLNVLLLNKKNLNLGSIFYILIIIIIKFICYILPMNPISKRNIY